MRKLSPTKKKKMLVERADHTGVGTKRKATPATSPVGADALPRPPKRLSTLWTGVGSSNPPTVVRTPPRPVWQPSPAAPTGASTVAPPRASTANREAVAGTSDPPRDPQDHSLMGWHTHQATAYVLFPLFVLMLFFLHLLTLILLLSRLARAGNPPNDDLCQYLCLAYAPNIASLPEYIRETLNNIPRSLTIEHH